MILETDGGKIYYEISDEKFPINKPILFVLPGGPGGDHSIYKFHSLELENFCCVVYHDPRGCGKTSEFDSSSATMEHYIHDIERLRRHLCINKFSILGTSYGSMCAIGYAIQYPNNLDKLILVGGAPSSRFLETAKANLELRGSHEQKEISKHLWDGSFLNNDHVREFMRIMKSLYSKNQNFINQPPRSGTPFSYEVLNLGFGQFLQNFDFEPNLKNITSPTLILVGEEDWVNDPIHLRKVANQITGSHLEILKDCGHFVAIDQNEIYINLIKEFIMR